MSRVFNAEVYRLKLNREYIWCLIFVALTAVLNIYGIKQGDDTSTASQGMFTFSSMLPILLSLTIANIACADHKNGLLKNLVSSGNKRSSIYFGKLSAGLFASTLYFLVDGIVTFVVYAIYDGVGKISPIEWLESIILQLAAVLIYALIFYGIGSIIRSSKFTTAICILFTFFADVLVAYIGKLVGEDFSAIGLTSLSNSANNFHVTSSMLVSIVVFLAFGALLNVLGYGLFKEKDI